MGSSLVLMAWDCSNNVTHLSKAVWGHGEGRQQGWHKCFFLSSLGAPWQGVPRGTWAAQPHPGRAELPVQVFGGALSLRWAFGRCLPKQRV